MRYIERYFEVGQGFQRHVNVALRRSVERGVLLQVRGVGASGSFKINKEKAISSRNKVE